jgi:ABC-type bacteriocin/lantibiotic exporter with double-glycine peptidase domain
MRTEPPKIYLMQGPIECETAVIATITQTEYDLVNKTMKRKRWLPDFIENPLYGNPLNFYWTLTKLGYWKDNITLSEFLDGKAIPYKTVMLVKKSLTKQHWVVFCGYNNDKFEFLWGDKFTPIYLKKENVINLFTQAGFVNDCFSIYKCNVFKKLWERFKINVKVIFKGLFVALKNKTLSLFKRLFVL